jgi:hypothetical protein
LRASIPPKKVRPLSTPLNRRFALSRVSLIVFNSRRDLSTWRGHEMRVANAQFFGGHKACEFRAVHAACTLAISVEVSTEAINSRR